DVLKELLNNGAQIRTLKGLHAKVYISASGVAVGSANFTPNGLDVGLMEAIAVVRGAMANHPISRWFDDVYRASETVAQRLNDPFELAQLRALWKARQNGHEGSNRTSSVKPSLLEAILC